MTGPEHYREAEKLVLTIARHPDSSDATALATRAQVHATLALAAATALQVPKTYTRTPEGRVLAADAADWRALAIRPEGEGQ